MKAAIYARVSTEEQATKYGLAAQVTELREFAGKKGFRILNGAEYLDDGYSGASLDRPALNKLRDAIKAGAFQALLILDPDRLARKLSHQLLLMEEFERLKVRVEFLTVSREETPEGRLLMNVKGIISEYEREKIKERTMRGKREKARRGLIVAGPIPFGYRADPNASGKLIVYGEEAAIVRQIFRWLAEEQKSIREITSLLRKQGIKPQRSSAWGKSSVARLLGNSTYAGTAYFNRRERISTETAKQLHRFKPRQEWIEVPVPSIIPRHLFEKAQQQLSRNKEILAGRPCVRFYLLKGLVHCGSCGRKYIGIPSHGKRIYRCAGRDRLAEHRCRAETLSAEKLESFVWQTVSEILQNPALLTEKVEAHQNALQLRLKDSRIERERLEKRLVELERQEERLVDAYLEEQLEVPGLRKRLEALKKQKSGLQQEISHLKEQEASHEAEKGQKEAVKRYCRLALKGLESLSSEGRQQLLRALLDKIVLQGKFIEFHGVLPGRWLPSNGNNRPQNAENVDGNEQRGFLLVAKRESG